MPYKNKSDNKKWYINNKIAVGKKQHDYKLLHKDEQREYNRKWRNTISGKETKARGSAKRRCLGNVVLFNNPFPENVPVDYHHISDAFVVAIPRDLHKKHNHPTNTKLHRDELQPFIEQIYNFTYVVIVNKFLTG